MGCGASTSSTSAVGTYLHATNSAEYIKLNPDGTFTAVDHTIFSNGSIASGTYKIDGTAIVLTFINPPGGTGHGTVQGNVLIDPDGERWVKQS